MRQFALPCSSPRHAARTKASRELQRCVRRSQTHPAGRRQASVLYRPGAPRSRLARSSAPRLPASPAARGQPAGRGQFTRRYVHGHCAHCARMRPGPAQATGRGAAVRGPGCREERAGWLRARLSRAPADPERNQEPVPFDLVLWRFDVDIKL